MKPLMPIVMLKKPCRDHTFPDGLLKGSLRTIVEAAGLRLMPGYLDRPAQEALLVALRAVIARAPIYSPRMPRTGKPMSVRMTNCGPLGWVTDEARGYRYQATHPETGAPGPPIPDILLAVWRALGGYPLPPEACLINFYSADAR